VEVTVVGRGDHFNSLTDKERPPNTTTIASGQAQTHAQSQLKHGSQHTSSPQGHLKESQHANHPEIRTRSNVPHTRVSDSINSRQSQATAGPKPARLPTAAGVAQLDEERESMLAARAIVVGTGAAPVMAVIYMILALHKEIVKVSNFLADNIRHTSYELFQDELDYSYQDSDKIIGERLTKFLHEHSDSWGGGAQPISHYNHNPNIHHFVLCF